MVDLLKPDLCVIGAGAGGSTAAASAAALGAKVVVVASPERAPLESWMATRFLLAAAREHRALRDSRPGNDDRADWTAVQARIAEGLAEAKPTFSLPRLKAMNAVVVSGTGRFVGRRAVEADGVRIEARRFVIATGSSPAMPKLGGLELVHWFTPETICTIAELPARLVVMGHGSEAVELAQAFRRLGAQVALVGTGFLDSEDPEMAARVLDALERDGVELVMEGQTGSLEPAGTGIRLHLGNGRVVEGSHLLLASGRRPNVDGLGLEAAGIRFGAEGVRVGRDLRTTNRRVFAIGDVIGGPPSVQAAAHHAGISIRKALLRMPVRFRPESVPRILFTDPEIASCGLDEARARAAYRHVRIVRASLGETERAALDRLGPGHLKVITAASGRILGAAIVGPSAGELIAPWQVAISNVMSITDMASVVFPRLTLSDVSRQAAVAGVSSRLRSPWLGRALAIARWFG